MRIKYILSLVLIPLLFGCSSFVEAPEVVEEELPLATQVEVEQMGVELPVEEFEKPEETLKVSWNGEAVKASGFDLVDGVESVYAYKVGEVVSGELSGADFLLIEVGREYNTFGHVRALRTDGGVIVLQNLSNYIEDVIYPISHDILDKWGVTLITGKYDVEGLEAPKTIELLQDGQKHVLERVYSKIAFYEKNDKPKYNVSVFGVAQGNENGNFEVEMPDHSVMEYKMRFPFMMAEEGVNYNDTISELHNGYEYTVHSYDGYYLDLNVEGKDTKSAWYFPFLHNRCSTPFAVSYDLDEGLLRKVGTLANGDGFYVPAEIDFVEYLDRSSFSLKYPKNENPDVQELLASIYENHPYIFWKDPVGRWVKFTNIENFQFFEGGCMGMEISALNQWGE